MIMINEQRCRHCVEEITWEWSRKNCLLRDLNKQNLDFVCRQGFSFLFKSDPNSQFTFKFVVIPSCGKLTQDISACRQTKLSLNIVNRGQERMRAREDETYASKENPILIQLQV